MGRRASNGAPLELRLQLNTDGALYETTEHGITYCLPFSYMDDLKRKYKHLYSVASWYSKLDNDGKKAVRRIGVPDDTVYYNDGNFIE